MAIATSDYATATSAATDTATPIGDITTNAYMAVATSDYVTATLLLLLTLLMFLLQQLRVTQVLEYAGGWLIVLLTSCIP